MNKKLLVSVTSAAAFLSFGVSTAFASTIQNVTVKHSAYLISAPRVGAKHLALEKTGSYLTVETGSNRYWWHVRDQRGDTGYITRNRYYTQLSNINSGNLTNASVSGSSLASGASVATASRATTQLPPGVSYNASVKPIALQNATSQAKFNAILQIAKSKLGTAYIWGHNEDRGQYGFDCSNFTAYVYHHALGYTMSGASQTQYHRVGWTVPKSQMAPGDLLVFNQGGHVGIYIGNGEMIQCGGGLGRVGYLKLAPGSYWYSHLSAVKRMY